MVNPLVRELTDSSSLLVFDHSVLIDTLILFDPRGELHVGL